ncbi:TolC family outer membrane protein [Agaribacterium sp. ZY112]|uniref:TolC family outer membrane protein n=1 Tax=Agaribacterium sp. ZY112 TaxID=3233574 RepID=UPI003525B7CF
MTLKQLFSARGINRNILRNASIAACLGLSAQFSTAEDLYYIYQQAVENDHEFKASQAAYQAGLEDSKLGRSALLPKINASANYTGSNRSVDGSESSTTQVLPSETDNTNSGYGISLVQPLFDMAAWQTYKAGKSTADVAEANYLSAQQELILRTAQAYFDILLAGDNYSTAIAEEDALKHQLEQTRQRFEVGLSAITEVHEAKAAYDNSVAEKLIAEGQLGISFEALEVLTGQSYQQIAPLKDNFAVSNPQPAARQAWVDRAIEGNPQLAAAEALAEASRRQAKQAKAGHYPVLSLNGNYASYNDDRETDFGYNSDLDSDDSSIGLTLTVPIYNGGAVSASRRQAEQQSIQAREQWLKAKRDVVQAARSQHLSVTTTVATVHAREQGIISTSSALEATQAGYSVGTRDLVDVLNAQQNLYQAKRNYYAALYTYIMSSLRLKGVAGMLTEQDLVQLNEWLNEAKPVLKTNS